MFRCAHLDQHPSKRDKPDNRLAPCIVTQNASVLSSAVCLPTQIYPFFPSSVWSCSGLAYLCSCLHCAVRDGRSLLVALLLLECAVLTRGLDGSG